jgi:hypothetical protein
MDAYLYESLARRRFNLLLLEIFAGLALALAAVGVYRVISHRSGSGSLFGARQPRGQMWTR